MKFFEQKYLNYLMFPMYPFLLYGSLISILIPTLGCYERQGVIRWISGEVPCGQCTFCPIFLSQVLIQNPALSNTAKTILMMASQWILPSEDWPWVSKFCPDVPVEADFRLFAWNQALWKSAWFQPDNQGIFKIKTYPPI